METQQEKLVRYLDDAWALEKSLVSALQSMAERTSDPNARTVYQEHSEVTHQQEERLEARIRALGAEPTGSKGILNTVLAKVSDMANMFHDQEDKTTQDLIKAFATENFECATYESLRAYASAIGDMETAKLAQEIMEQEKEAASKVWNLIAANAVQPAQKAVGTAPAATI